jgi:hypothetical protein
MLYFHTFLKGFALLCHVTNLQEMKPLKSQKVKPYKNHICVPLHVYLKRDN